MTTLWRQRRALERAGSEILRADRRRRKRASSVPSTKRPEPPLETRNGWVAGLTNLRRAMREKNRS